MEPRTSLLTEIEEFLNVSGMSPSTFGHKTANDGKLVSRLRSGSTVTLTTANAILAFIHAKRIELDCPPSLASRRRRRSAA